MQPSTSGINLPVVNVFKQYFINEPPAGESKANYILTWIGAAVASQGSFFVTFILTKGVLKDGIKFLKAKLPSCLLSIACT